MMLRSTALRAMLFLSTSALALAHPGHPGHEDDPYRMEAITPPLPELGYFLPLIAIGLCLALLQKGHRRALAGITAALLSVTAFTHASDPRSLAGLLASAACALACGAILGRAFLALRRGSPHAQPSGSAKE